MRCPVLATEQLSLLEPEPLQGGRLPDGLVYRPGWLSPAEEANLIGIVATLPFANALYKGFKARRRVVGYGGRFDFEAQCLRPAPPLIDALRPLRERVASFAGVEAESLVQTMVSQYGPGTLLGWHRDVPDFEDIVGVSLGGSAVMRFRPWPAIAGRDERTVRLDVQPRSIYRMRGDARWRWQHCVDPVTALRWSITFRTASSSCARR